MRNFVSDKIDVWQRLAQIVRRVETNGIQALSRRELDELGRLYRLASSHLARARARGERPEVVQHINQLVARAHGQIYRVKPASGRRLSRFFLEEFPRTFRQTLPFTIVATALFVLGAIGAHIAVTLDEESVNFLLDPGLVERSRGDFEAGHVEWWARGGQGPFVSSAIMANNLQVAFLAFATGIAACVGTVWVLVSNGVMLGGLAALYTQHGLGLELWALIAPHGVPELAAVFICGGAGLRLGWALIEPGDYTRRDALVLAARQAVRLVVGTVPIFILAGLIEGFITPIRMPPEGKILFAAMMALLLAAFLLRPAPAHPGNDDRFAR